MPSYGPETLVGHCRCGFNWGAHKPSEAYYGEFKLEGKRSSSRALREARCPEYRESGLTLREAFAMRGCMYKWQRVKRNDANVPAYHG